LVEEEEEAAAAAAAWPSGQMDWTTAGRLGAEQSKQGPKWNQLLLSFLLCFSLRKNLKTIGKHTLSSAQEPTVGGEINRAKAGANKEQQMGDIKVIHGVRTVAMVWIIFGHTIGLVSPEMMSKWRALSLSNSRL